MTEKITSIKSALIFIALGFFLISELFLSKFGYVAGLIGILFLGIGMLELIVRHGRPELDQLKGKEKHTHTT